MAPESSTQTDVERNAPSPSNPTFPSSAQHPAQTFAQQQQEQQPGFQDPRSYGPPYAPYPQPAGTAATGANQQWAPPRVEEPKAWMITKLTLHGLNILTCIIGLGLTGALRSVQTLGLIALGACPIVWLTFSPLRTHILTSYSLLLL